MWPEGKKSETEITKRPITAGTAFKTSIIALVENLLTKVNTEPPKPQQPAHKCILRQPPPKLPHKTSKGKY